MSFDIDPPANDIGISIPIETPIVTEKGETDFQCDQCGKYFVAARSLALHRKIHTGIRPYICPVNGCGKSFYVRAQLLRHSYTHSTDRPERCPYANCTSPITSFKTKADVRQHIRNWHTLEKGEQREMRLAKKIEKLKKLEESYRKLKKENKELSAENGRLREAMERNHLLTIQPPHSVERDCEKQAQQPRKPVPAYTQFLQEQYQRMKEENRKIPFTECSKTISQMWKSLSYQEKKPYLDRFRAEMDAYYANQSNPQASFPNQTAKSAASTTVPYCICKKCGSSNVMVLNLPAQDSHHVFYPPSQNESFVSLPLPEQSTDFL